MATTQFYEKSDIDSKLTKPFHSLSFTLNTITSSLGDFVFGLNNFVFFLSNQVISGRRYVGIMSAEPVGNYGVR